MLPIKKVYIDTRHKTADSVSNSDFTVVLSETMSMPEGKKRRKGGAGTILESPPPSTLTTFKPLSPNKQGFRKQPPPPPKISTT